MRRSVAATILLCAPLLSNAKSLSPPPFIPVERHNFATPADVAPGYPVFSPDGRAIVFWNLKGGDIWIMRSDGSGVHCISCELPDRAQVRGFLNYVLPDEKRILLTGNIGGGVMMLECPQSLFDCAKGRVLPVDLSADQGKLPVVQRRTWHLAPDGVHLGWMEVRPDGTVMIVARLERHADKYVAADPRVVNPPGPTSVSDQSADHWENLSELYELKSFTPDGKSILAVGLPNNNVDVLKIDLQTGKTTRLTANPDWDEDSSLSPDQQLFVVNSWRSRHRLDLLAWIPQIRGFTGLMIGAAIAPYYVSTWTGFQCDLSPWLLPASGDDGGRLVGQPLDIYGGDLTAADDFAGQQVWSPDSTKVLLLERSRRKGDMNGLNRVAMAQLDRAPTRPVAVTASDVGSWAPAATAYHGSSAVDRTVTVRGNAGGRATITYKGALGAGASTSVVYDRFTDDGVTFVDGAMSAASEMRGSGEQHPWRIEADVSVTGRHTGRLKLDLYIDNSAKPLPQMSGSASAVYDGKAAPPLPPLAACYAIQPKATPLKLDLKRDRGKVLATVTADIDGDVRPVMNATLRYGPTTVKTDFRGRASAAIQSGTAAAITASAGDTFVAATSDVPAN